MANCYYLISSAYYYQYVIFDSIFAENRAIAESYFDDVAYEMWGHKLDIESETYLKNYVVVTKTELKRKYKL